MTDNTNTLYSPFYQGVSNIPIGIAVARKREDLKKDDSGKLVILTAFVVGGQSSLKSINKLMSYNNYKGYQPVKICISVYMVKMNFGMDLMTFKGLSFFFSEKYLFSHKYKSFNL